VLLVLALYYMPTDPWTCAVLYVTSGLLDAVDGTAARHFDQCSKFGAVLDMVTDRSATTCLMSFLASRYAAWALLFQLLIALDLSSHYMQMYTSLTLGASSHKNVSASANPILRAYYTNNAYTPLFLHGV
jgi:CDP-diacylglycerol--inositol 3-phosphatidyltransferase